MEKTPNLQEAIQRFNQGCAAFERAWAVQAVDRLKCEVESRTAFVDVVGALEWAVKHCLEQYYSEKVSEEELRKATTQTFERMLKKLAQKAHPSLDRESRRELQTARQLRNLVQHEAAAAHHADLRKAIRVVRRILSGYLPALEEQLAVPPLEVESGYTAPVAHEMAAGLRPAHRHQGGDAWVTRALEVGLQRLRQGRAQHYDATIDSLKLEAKTFLTRQALDLLTADRRASGTLPLLSDYMEAEAKDLLLRGGGKGLSPEDVERLRHLLPLINRYPSLCLEAGWLCQAEGQGLRFKDTCFPALLVGRHLARSGVQASPFRGDVGRDRSWREAAWMAVSSGDELASWTALLLAERDPLWLLERVVVTCAAFAAVRPGTVASQEVATAFSLCVSALVAFAPRWVERNPSESFPAWMQGGTRRIEHDPDSPWFLPVELWRECVLDLADASWVLGASLGSHGGEPGASAPSPLAEMLSSLGLSARLSTEESRALSALCAPSLAWGGGLLNPVFFKQVFSVRSRMEALVQEPFLEAWMRSHGIRALKIANQPETWRALAIPGDAHPAGYLLNHAGLINDWHLAWLRLADSHPEDAVQGWVKAVSYFSGMDDASDALRQLLLDECLKFLSDRDLKSKALAALREECVSQGYAVDRVGERYTTQVAVLRLLDLGASGWGQVIARWTAEPALAWRTLLDAGAPQEDIAGWCIQKALLRSQAPAAYRDGPVGVWTHNIQALSTGPWQLAFQQAQEALDWILDEGDASALSVMAAACLSPASSPGHFDPVMGKLETNISMPLSMVLWPRVIHRPEGREAFYTHIERDGFPGDMFFLEGSPLPVDESEIWLGVASQLLNPRLQSMSKGDSSFVPEHERAEARRLLSCFEQRINTLWITEGQWPRMTALFESQGWPPPSLFPSKVLLQGEPWDRSWPRLEVQAIVHACAAAHGVDVAAPLSILFRQFKAIPVAQSGDLALVLGQALADLSQSHPGHASGVLEEALAPEILRSMWKDTTRAFWSALIRAHGSARVLARIDSLEPVDCGLGLVDALRRLDIESLRQRELRPELLRPLLIRASQGGYVPAARFWEEAWKAARSPAEIPELPELPPGPWLEALLTQSQHWEPERRQQLLRHLAGFSKHGEVRRRCVVTLLM
ncbi:MULTISPECIES: hypothetical protein [unclassified Corallococcus]|uniref:hypothetical protein n=1 Tax=unclassified Corallococcus TaxID=2685029 RepID=UPI001A8EDAC9|nr:MULTISPECIES: hypothetical protein [unclassified Corallococcus]MBN9686981.1 hypothetical protein [Corallococcus sp. NCSPR001]WAS89187.1 hypothetical protein O0N60_19935 [Corallococcus sp. NCRR]